ncbi:FAD-dependent monooxygenase, partial [bacterium]|nr:FAD-dependent monooxygenase [bacterium]
MSQSPDKEKITLIGAGLAGSLLSIFLAKRGFTVEVFERRPDMRTTAISAGRSINMALSTRGIHALQQVGIYDEIMQNTIPMKGRLMHALDGEISFHPYGKDDTEVIYSISRALLNITLMDAAERHPGVALHFEERCTGFDFETRTLKLQNRNQIDWSKPIDRVIGTDGSASTIRTDMADYADLNLSQQFIEH